MKQKRFDHHAFFRLKKTLVLFLNHHNANKYSFFDEIALFTVILLS
jgi:hypothetical protein